MLDATGEITAAAPIATIPFDGTAGETIRGLVDAIPSGSTDFILTLKDPDGNILQQIDTGTSPETVSPDAARHRHVHVRGVRLRRRTSGDFTFDVRDGDRRQLAR